MADDLGSDVVDDMADDLGNDVVDDMANDAINDGGGENDAAGGKDAI